VLLENVKKLMGMMNVMKNIEIYTDGGCARNPDGPGGYGVVLLYEKDGETYKKQLNEGYKSTTNNRMELMAVIKGLEALKEKCNVKLYSDSQYIVNAINKKWVYKWKSYNWYKSPKGKERPKNIDLWEKIIDLLDKHNVEFIWVRGHCGNFYNELCDKLANEAINSGNLIDDQGYISNID